MIDDVCGFLNQVTCFAEAGGQHVSGMARAVELLGLRACLTQSTMDAGEGLPASWVTRTTDECIQVENIFSFFCFFLYSSYNVLESYVDFPLIQFFFSLYCQMTQMCYVCITFIFFLILRAQLQKELYNKHHNTADGRIRLWFGIRQIMNSTDRLLLETRDAARQLKTGIHMVWNHGMCVCIHCMCVLIHSFISVTSPRISTLESTWYGTMACVYAFIICVFLFIAIYQLQVLEDDYLIDLFDACSSLLVKLEKC